MGDLFDHISQEDLDNHLENISDRVTITVKEGTNDDNGDVREKCNIKFSRCEMCNLEEIVLDASPPLRWYDAMPYSQAETGEHRPARIHSRSSVVPK